MVLFENNILGAGSNFWLLSYGTETPVVFESLASFKIFQVLVKKDFIYCRRNSKPLLFFGRSSKLSPFTEGVMNVNFSIKLSLVKTFEN